MHKKAYLFITPVVAMVLVIGALGDLRIPTLIVQGLLITLLLVLTLVVKKGKVFFPSGFPLYFLFLLISAFNTLASPDKVASLGYFLIFVGGGALWFVSFNLQESFGRTFENLVIFLGLVMAGLYLVRLITRSDIILPYSLFTPSSSFKNHSYIGDLWSLILLMAASRLTLEKSTRNVLFALLGFYLLAVSLSRSAIVGLFVGISYLFSQRDLIKKNKVVFALFIFSGSIIFLLASIQKTIFFSRPYINEAVYGLLKYPQGVGLGNFKAISSHFLVHDFSFATHNIILEVLIGLGWLGIVFVGWLTLVVKRILETRKVSVVYAAVFLALCANFFFNTAYTVPTMIWLWFLSLGLSYEKRCLRSRSGTWEL